MYDGHSENILRCLIRAIRHYKNEAEMLYENLPPKNDDHFELDFTPGITEIVEEDLLTLLHAAEGLANSIEDPLGTPPRHGEIATVIANNQELVNSCIDSYVDNLEDMKKLMVEAFAPANPKLTKLQAEFELALLTQKTWWKKHEE